MEKKKLFSKQYFLIKFVYDKEEKNDSILPTIVETKAQKFVEAISFTAATNKIKKIYMNARNFTDLTIR